MFPIVLLKKNVNRYSLSRSIKFRGFTHNAGSAASLNHAVERDHNQRYEKVRTFKIMLFLQKKDLNSTKTLSVQ